MPDAGAGPPFDGVIAVGPGAGEIVGGLRLVERAAFVLARAGARRLLCVGPRPSMPLRLPQIAVGWSADAPPWSYDATAIVVVTAATTVTEPATIAALVAATESRPLAAPPPACLWRADGATVAAQLRDARDAASLAPPAEATAWTPPPGGLVTSARDAESRIAAELALYARIGRTGDGWFTRVVDRRFSRALTRLLLPTGISPNQVTIASIAIGIAGGLCFARGTPGAAMCGALLFLLSTIIDGCDGEIARLTFRESSFGAKLDILGDNLVHLFLFGGIASGLHRRSGDPTVAVLGWVLLTGVLLAMTTVYTCIVRRPPTDAQRTVYEAFASREFAYLLVGLTLVGRLDWFLWMSALGTYAFSIALIALGRRATA